MTAAGWAPPHARPLARAVIAATRADPRIVGLTAGGSAATRTMDEFSDLDFVALSLARSPRPFAGTMRVALDDACTRWARSSAQPARARRRTGLAQA